MTDTSDSKRMPILGHRIPADLRDRFNTFARDHAKCQPAALFRALVEATVATKPTDAGVLRVSVKVRGGATPDEVRALLTEFIGAPKTVASPTASPAISAPKVGEAKPVSAAKPTVAKPASAAPTSPKSAEFETQFDLLMNDAQEVSPTILRLPPALTSDDRGALFRAVVEDWNKANPADAVSEKWDGQARLLTATPNARKGVIAAWRTKWATAKAGAAK